MYHIYVTLVVIIRLFLPLALQLPTTPSQLELTHVKCHVLFSCLQATVADRPPFCARHFQGPAHQRNQSLKSCQYTSVYDTVLHNTNKHTRIIGSADI